jgi:hypothetical protein
MKRRQQMLDIKTKCCLLCGVELTNDNQYATMLFHKSYRCIDCHKKEMGVSNKGRMYVNGKYVSREHPLYKPGRYKSFGDLAFGSLNNYKLMKEGYVYAIVNDAWPEWVKIGKAIDAEDRLSGYQTSSPMRDYKLVHSVYFEDRNVAERKAHTLAALKTTHPWNKHENGEWFKLTDAEAIEILKEITID